MLKTAIVILNWNGIEFLKKFLAGIVRYSTDTLNLVYVADNSSSDGSIEWLAVNFKDVKIIRLDKNYGFAEGYNRALEHIDAKYYVLINSDIEVSEKWLQPLVSFLDDNPDCAACQPKILSYSRKDLFEYAGAAGGYIDKYGYPFCRGRIFDNVETDHGQYNSPTDIFWASGACMIIRADAWKKCGGFDSAFFAHMEEIDLCWRLNKTGCRVSYVPESVVYHVGGGSLPYNSPFKVYLNFRNSLFMLYKNLPDNKLNSTLFIRKSLDGVAAIMYLLKGNFNNFKSVWNAHMDYYRAKSELRRKRALLQKSESNHNQVLILNKSIVFEFYIKGKKTYKSLKMEN
jgi:GT2 family glycosyltransferase